MSHQPLPLPWVAKIFQKLQGNYGTRFLNQWKTGQTFEHGQNKGEDVGVVNAMSVWAEKLGGFANQPERIARVIESLPDDPPSLPAFIGLLRATHVADSTVQIAYTQTPEDVARHREMSRRAAASVKAPEFDGLLWAKRPKSQKAMDFIADGKKHARRFPALAAIFDKHVADGVCSEAGKLLLRWDCASWVKA
jgi:hypothetical protein